jgi:tetratricopeptide (TPR) repeat protein
MTIFAIIRAKWLLRRAYWLVETGLRQKDIRAATPLLERAILILQKASSLMPDNPHIWNELAFVFGRLGRPEEALEPARRAVTLGPDHAKFHNVLIGIQQDFAARSKTRAEARKRLAEVLRAQEQVVRRFPDYPSARLGKAEILAMCGEKERIWEAEIDHACRLYEQQAIDGSGQRLTAERLKEILQNSRAKCLTAAKWWNRLPES